MGRSHETHYFADPFEPPLWRSQWVERYELPMGGTKGMDTADKRTI